MILIDPITYSALQEEHPKLPSLVRTRFNAASDTNLVARRNLQNASEGAAFIAARQKNEEIREMLKDDTRPLSELQQALLYANENGLLEIANLLEAAIIKRGSNG